MGYSRDEVAALIDHTLLKPEATDDDVRALVEEAKRIGAYSVCVSPSRLPLPADIDLGSVKLAAVCGFPSGAHHSEIKAAEAGRSVAEGADEIDMVIDLAQAVAGRFDLVEADIRAVREATGGAVLKVIIESAALSDEQIVAACEAARAAGADFVKTSTGFHPAGGASVHAVELMKTTVGDELEVKASGGIRDGKFAAELLRAGATRLGLSSSAKVLDTL
ncbi:MAG: deoxyribose-phosphate aldolase [Actinomycetaceae bacterium]|nr:deoxyribose-phosphate aldolase [Actinomycetaceae bacterium]